MKKKVLVALVLICTLLAAILPGSAETAKAYRVAFCNSYNGNSYRQLQEKIFGEEAEKLIAEGVLESYKILEANSDVATQVSQIESCVLEGYDAIIVDPASATGLNGAIEEAYDAGIPVLVINDGPVTTDKCWQLNNPCSELTPGQRHLTNVQDFFQEIPFIGS